VPREKVLTIGSVIEPFDSGQQVSDLQIPQNTLIESVAESVINSDKPVTVVDDSGSVIGTVSSANVVKVLFGDRDTEAQPS